MATVVPRLRAAAVVSGRQFDPSEPTYEEMLALEPGGSFAQGLRAGGASLSAGSYAADALDAEIAGRQAEAQDAYRRSLELQRQAAAVGPQVRSLRDVNSLGGAGEFAAGAAGQALATSVPVLASALVGRGLFGRGGAFLGGVTPAYLMEQGEAAADLALDPAARQRLTPEEIRNLTRTKGALNAALEVFGPAAAVERSLGKAFVRPTLRGAAGRTAAYGLGEGFTEGTQDIVGQGAKSFARTGEVTDIDPMGVADAFAQGLAGGAGLAAPTIAADAIKAGARPILERLRARPARSPADFSDLPPPDVLAQGEAAVMDWLEQNDAARRDAASQILGRPATDADVGLALQTEQSQRLRTRLTDVADTVASFAKGLAGGRKKNEQTTADRKLALDVLASRLPDDVVASDEFRQAAPHFVDLFLGKANRSIQPAILRDFIEIYGDEAAGVAFEITDVFARAGAIKDPQRISQLFEQALADHESRQALRLRALSDNLSNEARLRMPQELGREVSDADLRTYADMVSRYVAGSLDKKTARAVERELEADFGDRKEAVLKVFRAAHDMESDASATLFKQDEDSDATDFDAARTAESYELMLGDKGVEWSFASRPNRDTGRGKFFSSREEAERRWQQNVAPLRPDMEHEVVDAAAYAADTGTDPLALAQELGATAENAQAAVKALKGFFVGRMRPTTNRDPEALTRQDMAKIVPQRKGVVVEGPQQGKAVKRVAGTAAHGRLYAMTPQGQEIAVSAPALVGVMRGKKQKQAFGGKTEESIGSTEMLELLAAGLARLADSEFIDGSKGIWTLNEKGEKQYVMGGEQNALPDDLKLPKGRTAGGVAKGRQVQLDEEQRAYLERLLKAARAATIEEQGIDFDALKKAYDDAVQAYKAAKKTGNKEAREEAWKARTEAWQALDAAFAEIDPELMLERGEEMRKAREAERAAETEYKTDTDSNSTTDKEEIEAEATKHKADAAFADVQRRTREQSRPVKVKPKPAEKQDPLEAIKALAARVKTSALPVAQKNELLRRLREAYTVARNGPAEHARALYAEVKAALEGKKTKAANEQKPAVEATEEELTEAADYLMKVLGPKIRAEFVKDLGYSGEWEKGDTVNVIRIATNAGPGVLSVAQHEAMHEFFYRLTHRGGAEVAKLLLTAANSPTVRRQLERLLAGEPAALKQIASDPEERLAYMYQFWAAGKLRIGPETRTVFEKITAFFRKVTGWLREDEKAQLVLEAFHEGKLAKLSSFGTTMRSILNTETGVGQAAGRLKPLLTKLGELGFTADAILRESGNEHFQAIADLFYTPGTSTAKGTGYLNAKPREMGRWLNRLNALFEGLDKEDLAALREAMQTGKPAGWPAGRRVQKETRKLLDDFHEYLTGAGLKVGRIKNYFPQVWDVTAVVKRSDRFVSLLLQHHGDVMQQLADEYNKRHPNAEQKRTAEDVAMSIMQSLLHTSGVGSVSETESHIGYSPLMNAIHQRRLTFIDKEAFKDFFEQDMVKILSSYLSQGVKRAEYARRFGDDGAVLRKLLEDGIELEAKRLNEQGLSKKDAMARALEESGGVRRAVMALEGTLGYDISPRMRRFSSAMMAYQNLRLLPLALFSSLVDPIGLVVRGGTLDDALAAFRRGIGEIVKQIKGDKSRDELTRLAEALGTVDNASFLDALGETYSSVYTYGLAKKINGAVFKWNGMEAWNRAMRVQATAAAIGFIKRHVEQPNEHSERFLAELGLEKADVRITNGELNLGEPKIQEAVQRWVDSAVLRPNAAQRPAWASDPHWALLFHLKQFTYSFHKVILARATHEWRHGNLMPALALAWYVPVMIAADMARAMIQGMGDEPDWQKGWTVQDYVMNGVQRAGMLGVVQFGIDAYKMGAESVLGPTAEQVVDAAFEPLEKTTVKALPVNPVFKEALS